MLKEGAPGMVHNLATGPEPKGFVTLRLAQGMASEESGGEGKYTGLSLDRAFRAAIF